MLDGHGSEVARAGQWSWARVMFSAVALAICTNGPSVVASLHVFHVPASGLTWTYLFPFAGVGAVGIFGIGRCLRRHGARGLPWPLFAIGAFVAWTLLSVLWTVSPSVTPLNALLDIGIVAFGCWFGWALSAPEQIYGVAIGMSAPVIASLPLIAWWPDIGRSPIPYVGASYGGDWIGIYANRNSLGAVCVLAVIGLVGAFAIRPSWRRAAVLAPIAIAELVVMSGADSDTGLISLACCTLGAALIPMLWLCRRLRVPLHTLFALTFLALVISWKLLFDNLDTLAAKVGRDPTLSNRRTIWADVRTFIADRPLRGYGYWGFWDQGSLTGATYARVGKDYASAHNSVLEVLLMLGVIGLLLYAAIAVASVGGIVRMAYYRVSACTWWWTVVVVYLVAENLTESFVLWHSYNWVLFVAAALVPFGQRERLSDQHSSVGEGPSAPLERSDDAVSLADSND